MIVSIFVFQSRQRCCFNSFSPKLEYTININYKRLEIMKELKEILVTCPYCEDGSVEADVDCNLPASMCCGGCTKMEMCESCEGSAEIDIIDNVGIEVNEIRKMVQDLRISLKNLDIDNVEDTIKQLIFKD